MHNRRKAAIFALLAMLSMPATAQAVESDDTGVATETQERHARGSDDNMLWNLLGALGLLGLFGLRRESDNDGYTDDPI